MKSVIGFLETKDKTSLGLYSCIFGVALFGFSILGFLQTQSYITIFNGFDCNIVTFSNKTGKYIVSESYPDKVQPYDNDIPLYFDGDNTSQDLKLNENNNAYRRKCNLNSNGNFLVKNTNKETKEMETLKNYGLPTSIFVYAIFCFSLFQGMFIVVLGIVAIFH